jgi:hypothetical protein
VARHIIVKAAERHAAKVAKRALVAIKQSGQPFVAIPAGKQTPRIGQREHEQVDRLRLLPDPDLQLAVIDLRLFARLSPERTSLSQLPANADDHDAALTGGFNRRCTC